MTLSKLLGLSEQSADAERTYLARTHRNHTGHLAHREALDKQLHTVLETGSHTLLFRHFFSTNQVPVGCPKNQKLAFALRPF